MRGWATVRYSSRCCNFRVSYSCAFLLYGEFLLTSLPWSLLVGSTWLLECPTWRWHKRSGCLEGEKRIHKCDKSVLWRSVEWFFMSSSANVWCIQGLFCHQTLCIRWLFSPCHLVSHTARHLLTVASYRTDDNRTKDDYCKQRSCRLRYW